jgi:hypothetical protein
MESVSEDTVFDFYATVCYFNSWVCEIIRDVSLLMNIVCSGNSLCTSYLNIIIYSVTTGFHDVYCVY